MTNGEKVKLSTREVVQYIVMIIGFVSMFFVMRGQVEYNSKQVIENKSSIEYLKKCANSTDVNIGIITTNLTYITNDLKDIKNMLSSRSH